MTRSEKCEESAFARLLRAAYFAALKHRSQRRKGSEADPYINHPLHVASLLAGAGKTSDVNVLIAALLHDAVEDTDATLDDIREQFGEEVADLVAEVSDDKSLPKHERKALQVEHAAAISR